MYSVNQKLVEKRKKKKKETYRIEMVIVVDITFSVEETNQTVNRGRNKFVPIVRNKAYLGRGGHTQIQLT